MKKPVKSGAELLEQIERTITATPALWWLGQGGFIMRFATITFYIDPQFSGVAPLDAGSIRHADLVLATSAASLDAAGVAKLLESSKTAKLVLPKSAAGAANSAGIPFGRMTTTDADLRIEYFKDNLYGRVYAIPSARPELDWTADGGYPYLGYLIRFGRWTVYHSGGCVMYDSLIERLRPYNVSVALLEVGNGRLSIAEAAEIACATGAAWMVPIDREGNQESAFAAHMLGQRPEQAFKIFECAEKWTVPEE